MASYRSNLPSLHLDPDELKDLEQIMKRHLNSAKTEIQVGSGGFTRSYDTVAELLNDSSIPAHILEFEITVRGDEGTCKLKTNSSGTISTSNRIYISGDEDWIKTKKTDLDEFLSRKNKRLRTILEKMRFLFPLSMLLGLVTALPVYLSSGGQLAYWVGLGSYILYYFLGMFGLNYVYPYAMIQTEEGRKYRPYLRKLISWFVGLITVIAGVLTILNYLS